VLPFNARRPFVIFNWFISALIEGWFVAIICATAVKCDRLICVYFLDQPFRIPEIRDRLVLREGIWRSPTQQQQYNNLILKNPQRQPDFLL